MEAFGKVLAGELASAGAICRITGTLSLESTTCFPLAYIDSANTNGPDGLLLHDSAIKSPPSNR